MKIMKKLDNIYDQMLYSRDKLIIEVNALLEAGTTIANNDTYEKRCSVKFTDRFEKLQISYGALLDFALYLDSSSRYFHCEHCKLIIKKVVSIINGFITNYEMML